MNTTIAAWPHKMPYNDFVLKVLQIIYTEAEQKEQEFIDLCAGVKDKSPEEIVKMYVDIQREVSFSAFWAKVSGKKEEYLCNEPPLLTLISYLTVAYNKVFYRNYNNEVKIVLKVAEILNLNPLPMLLISADNAFRRIIRTERLVYLNKRLEENDYMLSSEELKEFSGLESEINSLIEVKVIKVRPSIVPDQTN